jgi:small subunit ribosomal protein S17
MAQEPASETGSGGQRTTKVGVVVSDVCEQTVTIKVVTPVRHKKYHRIIRRTTRFLAHDAQNRCKIGDMVEIRECRPISKRKHWRVVRVIRGARVAVSQASVEGVGA